MMTMNKDIEPLVNAAFALATKATYSKILEPEIEIFVRERLAYNKKVNANELLANREDS